jgi:hypothetical protein
MIADRLRALPARTGNARGCAGPRCAVAAWRRPRHRGRSPSARHGGARRRSVGSHVGQINFAIGFLAGIKAFTAAVLGGIGSIPGAVLGGLILGWTESFAAGYVSSAYEDAFAFCLLVAILVVRPSGLLGRSTAGRA